jgi:hypothetical protein
MATNRAESFSDGVCAVAVTLLVLDLGVHHVRPGGLASVLGHEWPHYVTFVVSFLLLLSITFTATNTWSARRRLWRAGISSEEMSQQLGRASIGLLLYSAAVGLAFVDAIVSLVLCAFSAVYYAFPSRV